MWHRSWTALCISALCLGLASMPTRAAETRLHAFNLACDGTVRNVVFNATGFAASVSRLIQGGSLALSRTRGGINFLRLQVAADTTKIVLVMGSNEVSARVDLTGFMSVTTDASGIIPFQIVGSCNGGGSIHGFATLYFF